MPLREQVSVGAPWSKTEASSTCKACWWSK